MYLYIQWGLHLIVFSGRNFPTKHVVVLNVVNVVTRSLSYAHHEPFDSSLEATE